MLSHYVMCTLKNKLQGKGEDYEVKQSKIMQSTHSRLGWLPARSQLDWVGGRSCSWPLYHYRNSHGVNNWRSGEFVEGLWENCQRWEMDGFRGWLGHLRVLGPRCHHQTMLEHRWLSQMGNQPQASWPASLHLLHPNRLTNCTVSCVLLLSATTTIPNTNKPIWSMRKIVLLPLQFSIVYIYHIVTVRCATARLRVEGTKNNLDPDRRMSRRVEWEVVCQWNDWRNGWHAEWP